MDIICDNPIWYGIGSGDISTDFLGESDRLFATFISIEELARTENNIKMPEASKNAIQAMFRFSKKHAIFTPPFAYLKEISDSKFNYDVIGKVLPILKLTEQLAKGNTIDKNQVENYLKQYNEWKDKLQAAADFFNTEAQRIKGQIKDNGKHRKENSIPINREMVAHWVLAQTEIKTNTDDLNWGEVELFEKTLKLALNDLETGSIVFKQNDWYDLFNLIYVSPGKLYWTRDGKWINLIKKAGMGHYLLEK